MTGSGSAVYIQSLHVLPDSLEPGKDMIVFSEGYTHETIEVSAPSDWHAVLADRGVQENSYAVIEVLHNSQLLSSQKLDLCQDK